MAIRQAMVAPLVGESGAIGLFTIANRLTEGTEFGADDLRLLETLANQAGVALENGQLEQSLAELSRLKEQLRYQAYHDPLTDLPNRVQFIETATTRIADQDGRARPAILLLDLDDFKNVNDTMGHAAGDEPAGDGHRAPARLPAGGRPGRPAGRRRVRDPHRRPRGTDARGRRGRAPDRRPVGGLPGPRP